MRKVDVAIIGAGTAGLSARREVAKITDNYVVIDDGPLGTTCARTGCMPSKVLIQVANIFHRRHQFSQMGIYGANELIIDTKNVMQHVRKLRDRFVNSVFKDMKTWQDKLIKKRSRFIDANTLDLGDEKIEANKIIIATGSSPVIPGTWKQYSKHFIDTDSFFELEELPRNIGVIGLGVIGLEIGQALHRLGVEIVGIDQRKVVGGLSDPELKKYTVKKFCEEMNLYFDGADIVGEEKNGLVIKSGNHQWKFEKVFLTMGRRPNLAGLGLEEIGVHFNENKIPVYDHGTFQIKDFPIYLVGDTNNERPVLHEASDEGRIAGYNSVRDSQQCFQRRTSLAIVFSDPNISIVGKGYQQLKNEGVEFSTGEVSFEGQGRAIVKLKEVGLVHIYAEKTSGKLLGAEIFAPEGEHLAHLLAWAISLNLTAFQTLSLPFYHPVMEEGLRTALRNLSKKIETERPALEVLRCQDPPAGTKE